MTTFLLLPILTCFEPLFRSCFDPQQPRFCMGNITQVLYWFIKYSVFCPRSGRTLTTDGLEQASSATIQILPILRAQLSNLRNENALCFTEASAGQIINRIWVSQFYAQLQLTIGINRDAIYPRGTSKQATARCSSGSQTLSSFLRSMRRPFLAPAMHLATSTGERRILRIIADRCFSRLVLNMRYHA